MRRSVMARKTFISYKYSEAQELRDKILEKLGDDATYYRGETADSPDLTDASTETIKESLKDMMYDTSVTIVVISPNMVDSKWIDWEIEYCLKEISREGRSSKTNGIVGVIKKTDDESYSWLVSYIEEDDGCSVRRYDETKLYSIIKKNRFNQNEKYYACNKCNSVSALEGSYISLIDEEDFLNNPEKYIENAYKKSDNSDDYDLTKQG